MISRRNVLLSAGLFGLGLSMRSISFASDRVANCIALLSDTHIPADIANEYRGFKPYENLGTVVDQVLQSPCEYALLCGDAARLEGKVEDYERLQSRLGPLQKKMPISIALGNHDDRANFWKVFGSEQSNSPLAGKKHITTIDFGTQTWIMLDSLMYVDKTPGLLGKEQRQWLDQYLEVNASKPVVLMVHHTLGDQDGELLDADKLLAIAKRHRHVKAVIFGHSHVWSLKQVDDLWHINLPAIGYNFADEQPVGWVKANLAPKELVLELNAIGGNQADSGKSHSIPFRA